MQQDNSSFRTRGNKITTIMLRNFRNGLRCRKSIGYRGLSHIPKLHISSEVEEAVKYNKPVVSLESTIITHGLPYPENIAMAKRVEEVVRSYGAVPATVAFIDGKPTVGLTEKEIEYLADANGESRVKISRRDIPLVMSLNQTGGTTIAATMILSKLANISVFATGGLGGVHRHGEVTMDVSADLDELSKTPVAVVCSGPKSILDVQRTMEYLETKGVPVMTYDDGDFKDGPINIPGFYTRDSGVPSPYTINSILTAAKVIESGKSLDLENGFLFCIPPPVAIALPSDFINEVIKEAQHAAQALNITGKAVTPFMLDFINTKTKGESVSCNVSFVLHNAGIASQIAKELSVLRGGSKTYFEPPLDLRQKTQREPLPSSGASTKLDKKAALKTFTVQSPAIVDAVVVGSIAMDNISKISAKSIMGDSNPGSISSSAGGVGFNIALAAHNSGKTSQIDRPVVKLISAVGKDIAGEQIRFVLEDTGLTADGIEVQPEYNSAQYSAVHDSSGSLVVACADMSITENLSESHVTSKLSKYSPKFVLFDSNIMPDLMSSILKNAPVMGYKSIYEPTSVIKANRLSKSASLHCFPNNELFLMTPTLSELETLYKSFTENEKFSDFDEWFPVLDALGVDSKLRMGLDILSQRNSLVKRYLERGVFQQALNLLPYCPNIILKDGAQGITIIQITSNVEDDMKLVNKTAFSLKGETASSYSLVGEGKQGMGVIVQHFPAADLKSDIKNVTGAGDSLAGYLLYKLSSSDSNVLEFSNELREKTLMGCQLAAFTSLNHQEAINVEGLRHLE
ncbi:unnamed protein product [Kuraishia capsulata CBS 1993]|uniref:Carbohydrate kinase PfkB domain-containing protein n=1 Tax=Kuraishia capsulata CBS 1993 TaxID=1382522 RepID=W6MGX4_9ASCO|nr:uncharacterized protein KUCA_T00000840001 [Kuraishia capsulata CBS 1993]CDK24873.1 unnamed protein product [Kuraishia capsulata CBS 1993]